MAANDDEVIIIETNTFPLHSIDNQVNVIIEWLLNLIQKDIQATTNFTCTILNVLRCEKVRYFMWEISKNEYLSHFVNPLLQFLVHVDVSGYPKPDTMLIDVNKTIELQWTPKCQHLLSVHVYVHNIHFNASIPNMGSLSYEVALLDDNKKKSCDILYNELVDILQAISM